MMADAARTLLDDLESDDWSTVRDAVETAGDRLRRRRLDAELAEAIGVRLYGLASHPKWQVRKAVAHALLYLRHERFHAAIARIIDDDNVWVRDAARRTFQRRTEVTRADIHSDDHGDRTLALLNGLEARYGPRARRAAHRLADQMDETFVRMAYHEMIRIISPLDAELINLERELADTPGAGSESRGRVVRAQRRVRLMTEFLDNLRAFTTEVRGPFTSEVLLPLAREAEELALDDLEPSIAAPAIHVAVDPAIRVEANRSRLLQALINLLVNAVEAFRDGGRPGRIEVTAEQLAGGHVALSVADNGRGMDEDAVEECTQLYSTGRRDGMGFGLPLAKKIVELDHHGTLTIESAEGEGTTVTMVLPVEQLGAEA